MLGYYFRLKSLVEEMSRNESLDRLNHLDFLQWLGFILILGSPILICNLLLGGEFKNISVKNMLLKEKLGERKANAVYLTLLIGAFFCGCILFFGDSG